MSSVSTDYSTAMASIRAEVEAYCQTNGIDPDEFLANLDTVKSSALFDNPALLAYLELAATQLMEVIAPDKINSDSGEVIDILGLDENGHILFRDVDSDLQDLISGLLEDDPELVAYFVSKSAGSSEADAFLKLLADSTTSKDSATDQARALASDLGVSDQLGWVMDTDDMYSSMQESIMSQLAEYDQATNDLIQAFSNGDISESAYQGQLSSMSSQREILVGLLNYAQQNKSSFFEMVSDLYKTMNETMKAMNNNIKF